MNNDQKQEIKTLFLEEAEDYLNTIESNLLGLANSSIDQDNMDQVLRAAHSIKGGAAMMGFQDISEIAHRLEDYFKIIKGGRVALNNQLERLFLKSVDGLREMIPVYRQGEKIEPSWLETKIKPILNKLHDDIGDLKPEDEEALLAIKNQDKEEDMSFFLFETEVESILTDLETIIGQNNASSIKEKLSEITLELGGLAEMLELPNFSSLCQSIDQSLQDNPDKINLVSQAALQQLRRSQALVLASQPHLIPTEFSLEDINTVSSTPAKVEHFEENQLLEKPEDLTKEFVIETEESELLPNIEKFDLVESIPDLTIEESMKATSSSDSASKSNKKTTDQTIRVSASQIEELGDLFGELTIERNGLDLQIKNLRNILNFLRQKVQHLEKSNFQLRTLYDQISVPSLNSALSNSLNAPLNTIPSPDQSFDLLEMDRYNDLHLVSGDMMETIVQIDEITNDFEIYLSDTEKLNRELTRTSKLMQNNLTKVRMRPLSDLLKRFPRALRDMEIQYNKRVDFQIKGGSTLLEKNVLESLNDPLLHLFRNAFDHGIEDTETRKKLGKPEVGKIEISATYRGNQTIIAIADDGKGINLEKIKVKAKKMGLDDEDLAKTSEKELLDLIFEAGFSTTDTVTDLSGRGVGMDVVRQNVESIGGEIVVETKQGRGTKFILSVPFTLSVVRVLIVESDNMLLAFPSNAVEEVNLLNKEQIIEKDGQEYLRWDEEEEAIRLINLRQYFNFNYSTPSFETEAIPIISEPTLLMIENDENSVGLLVERYWGEQEVTIRQVEGNIKMPAGFNNCTILGDGTVVPLIDTVELLNWISKHDNQALTSPNSGNNYGESKQNGVSDSGKKNILVVDDSINVRRFLALTFSQQNYHVEQAKDGQDALEKLASGISSEAIICDIEMPRLDGYGFLANVKSNSNFKNIPVVMLTSRSGDKHRKMAMNLGASAYFSKPFQEKELVSLINSLTN